MDGRSSTLASRSPSTDTALSSVSSASTPANALSVVFLGRLDNRAELARDLDIPLTALVGDDDSSLIRAAWQRWRGDLPRRLLGDFALAIVDPIQQRLLLARDPLGVKPLYYQWDGRVLVFASSVALLRRSLHEAPTADPGWIARYLLGLSHSYHLTAYREIKKLAPGHTLSMDDEGEPRIEPYFSFRDDPPPARRRDGRWVEAYRLRLEEAIRCRMPDTGPLGTENSGGLDSATITAYLARMLGESRDRLHAFGFVLAERTPGLVMTTSQHAGLIHNYLITAPPRRDDAVVDRVLSVLGYPEEHASASTYELFYRECQLRGIRTLFSGFGGDEVVTNPAQNLYQEMLDDGNFQGLWEILPGHVLVRGLRFLKAVAIGHRQQEIYPHFLAVRRQRWSQRIVRDALLERFDLTDVYRNTLRYSAPYRRINDFILDNRLSPSLSTRLENCTLVAAHYGVEYRWPLLDIRLIQQYLSTPGIEKGGPHGIGRYLHRRAVSGVLPPEVVWNPSKDMGNASVFSRISTRMPELIEEARRQEALLHPALEELVDREKFRDQIRQMIHSGGEVNSILQSQFLQNMQRLRWLNHWLYGEPPD